MPFPTRAEYEALIYALGEDFPKRVVASTLRLYSTSALTARVEGEVQFASGVRLHVAEFLDFRIGRILDYSYAVFLSDERIRWYDSQPHPEIPELVSTFPHHCHERPDIKNNRRPATGISFDSPNLPVLIADCLELGETISRNS
ncbi:MAG: DUF6516 family protein [Thermodesulfobacteriota bacterium]